MAVGPSSWTFLSNHAHVLILIGRDGDLRMRDLAERVGITERAVHRIVKDLADAGYIRVTREGRRNHYDVHRSSPLRHPVEEGATVGALLDLIDGPREFTS